MPRFPFLQLDAFADRPLAGNPCAVLLDTDELDTVTMQAIARENNLSETTGSATGAMGAYLWRHRLVERPEFVAEQGHGMGRPGRGQVSVLGPPEDIRGVEVTGRAVVVIRGEFEL